MLCSFRFRLRLRFLLGTNNIGAGFLIAGCAVLCSAVGRWVRCTTCNTSACTSIRVPRCGAYPLVYLFLRGDRRPAATRRLCSGTRRIRIPRPRRKAVTTTTTRRRRSNSPRHHMTDARAVLIRLRNENGDTIYQCKDVKHMCSEVGLDGFTSDISSAREGVKVS